MREILKSFGFIMVHDCKCGGSLQESWQSPYFPRLYIDIRPERGSFEIWYNRPRVHVVGKYYDFERELRTVMVMVKEELNNSRQTAKGRLPATRRKED